MSDDLTRNPIHGHLYEDRDPDEILTSTEEQEADKLRQDMLEAYSASGYTSINMLPIPAIVLEILVRKGWRRT